MPIFENPPGLLQESESLGHFGPEVSRGVSGALCGPGSGVPKKCPKSVPGVSKRCSGHSGDTLGTLFGHSGARDTPARETPVAGRGGCKPIFVLNCFYQSNFVLQACRPNRRLRVMDVRTKNREHPHQKMLLKF